MSTPSSPPQVVSLDVEPLAKNSMAFTNSLYVNPCHATSLLRNPSESRNFVLVASAEPPRVMAVRGAPVVSEGGVQMPTFHRELLGIKPGHPLRLQPWTPGGAQPPEVPEAGTLRLRLTLASKQRVEMGEDEMASHVLDTFGHQVLHEGQEFATLHKRAFKVRVERVEVMAGGAFDRVPCAIVTGNTQVSIEAVANPSLQWNKSKNSKRVNLVRDIKFEDMGIGGLDAEFDHIIRRAFATRLFPPAVVEKMGIAHVKGMLLYGPPGTGKTLIARQIGKMLDGREPKIVNGPEILNKFVGQSEENIRKLFEDAEVDQKENGDAADLHIIIFDELDAICRVRGSSNSGTGVHDTIVNQILSKMDGVDSLNNILVIGMTNRKEMIDPALLRPGRLEVHLEISLPNEEGRVQILKIHTAQMRKNGFLGDDVNLLELAERTKNFSGAEIEGLVRSAQSFALRPAIDVHGLEFRPTDDTASLKVRAEHFEKALLEVRPAFGVEEGDLDDAVRGGIIRYGPSFDEVHLRLQRAVNQVRVSEHTPLLSVLLTGAPGCGKTALAADVARGSGLPFVRIVSPADMVGLTEHARVNRINAVFEDAFRSDAAVVILDSLERLLDFVPLGPRFSNPVLQALLVLVKRVPPKRKRLLVVGTTSEPRIVRELGLGAAFNIVTRVPQLEAPAEVRTVVDEVFDTSLPDAEKDEIAGACPLPISVKTLLLGLDMSRQSEGGATAQTVVECLADVHSSGGDQDGQKFFEDEE